MKKLLFLFTLLQQFVYGQSTPLPTKTELTKIYSQSIADFILAANKKNKTNFDTLFIGKRVNHQSDDFPDIELPKIIQKVNIIQITPEAGKKSQNEKKSRIYINLIGWVNKNNAEFIFVVFSNGFQHQYDYTLNYKYNTQQKKFKLEKLQLKEPPFNK